MPKNKPPNLDQLFKIELIKKSGLIKIYLVMFIFFGHFLIFFFSIRSYEVEVTHFSNH